MVSSAWLSDLQISRAQLKNLLKMDDKTLSDLSGMDYDDFSDYVTHLRYEYNSWTDVIRGAMKESKASESDGMQVDWWDSLSQDERSNWMNSFSMTPTDGSIYMDNYDEMDSSNQYYVKNLFKFVKDDMDNDLLGRNHDILEEAHEGLIDNIWGLLVNSSRMQFLDEYMGDMNIPLMITMGSMSMPQTNEEVADALGVSKSEALKFISKWAYDNGITDTVYTESKASEVRSLNEGEKYIMNKWLRTQNKGITSDDMPSELTSAIVVNGGTITRTMPTKQMYQDYIDIYFSDVYEGESKASEKGETYHFMWNHKQVRSQLLAQAGLSDEHSNKEWDEIPEEDKTVLKLIMNDMFYSNDYNTESKAGEAISDSDKQILSDWVSQNTDWTTIDDLPENIFIPLMAPFGDDIDKRVEAQVEIINYMKSLGESNVGAESWSQKSSIDRIEALEKLGIKQGDAIKLSGLEFEDFGEDLQGALKDDDDDKEEYVEVANPNSEFQQYYPDYNNIGESQTVRTKYECEYCDHGFKSNEALSIHYNDKHAIAPESLDGYATEKKGSCKTCGMQFTEEDYKNAEDGEPSPVGDYDDECYNCQLDASEADPDFQNDPDFQGYTKDEDGNKVKSHPSQYTASGWDNEKKERMNARGDVDGSEFYASEYGGGSPMSDTFHNWLDQCPVNWYRENIDDNSATYRFVEDEYEKEGGYASPMSDYFHDWLDKCPTNNWHRQEIGSNYAIYLFIEDEYYTESKASEHNVGDYVTMTDDALDNYGQQYKGQSFRISHVAKSVDDHRGYDEGMGGENLYDFDGFNSSLYDYEVESTDELKQMWNESKASEARKLNARQKKLIEEWVGSMSSPPMVITSDDLPYSLLSELRDINDFDGFESAIMRYASDLGNKQAMQGSNPYMHSSNYGSFESKASETISEDEKDEIFQYLFDLQESGATNMFGSGAYVERDFPHLDKREVGDVITEWMANWDEIATRMGIESYATENPTSDGYSWSADQDEISRIQFQTNLTKEEKNREIQKIEKRQQEQEDLELEADTPRNRTGYFESKETEHDDLDGHQISDRYSNTYIRFVQRWKQEHPDWKQNVDKTLSNFVKYMVKMGYNKRNAEMVWNDYLYSPESKANEGKVKSYCNICGYDTWRNEGEDCPYHQRVLSDGTFLWDEFNQDGEGYDKYGNRHNETCPNCGNTEAPFLINDEFCNNCYVKPPESKWEKYDRYMSYGVSDADARSDIFTEAGLEDHSCPECGFITSDNSDYVDHLNAHEE